MRRTAVSSFSTPSPGIIQTDFERLGIAMAATKKTKKEKKPETTAEFVERMGKQDEKRSGLKIRFGFTKRTR